MSESKAMLLKSLGISASDLPNHIHDLREALQTMHYVAADLKAGYKFDDAQAPAKLRAFEASAATLCREAKTLLDLYLKIR